jgi:hypothetical protein
MYRSLNSSHSSFACVVLPAAVKPEMMMFRLGVRIDERSFVLQIEEAVTPCDTLPYDVRSENHSATKPARQRRDLGWKCALAPPRSPSPGTFMMTRITCPEHSWVSNNGRSRRTFSVRSDEAGRFPTQPYR